MPSHNVFVTESFMDELAAAAKQVIQSPIGGLLLDQSPRAKAVLDLLPRKKLAGESHACPKEFGRGVSLQFVFGT